MKKTELKSIRREELKNAINEATSTYEVKNLKLQKWIVKGPPHHIVWEKGEIVTVKAGDTLSAIRNATLKKGINPSLTPSPYKTVEVAVTKK
jgi:hypothetical protein